MPHQVQSEGVKYNNYCCRIFKNDGKIFYYIIYDQFLYTQKLFNI